ncbi:NACHT, LRR and PYD domains-containing protein 1 isoform X1 [Tachysurus fulvidraco]|uniref:NACHT, LRR and PYD domains-containing protein 1 isoform X1 n=1 Tax=Tachysurus fulvidraco TaxID=1234273 RepID=UPI001FEDFAA2|nr:NACHT, LRR and PYD domains-containing protein 1 isoform X1 [Tachysurus fulvidraco]
MVAKMANFGDTKDDGNRDVPASELKDSQTDNEYNSSESAESSSEDSADEEEEEEEEEENERDPENVESCAGGVTDASCTETGPDTSNGHHIKPFCEKCSLLQKPVHQLVTPREICENRWQLTLEDEGVYECSETGLVFEVSQKVRIRYRVLSWSKFGAFLNDSWKLAGPIFDVDCDPSILKSIQFPHSLCLSDQDNEVKFSVLHVKDHKGLIEPSVDHSRSHIKWNVSSLSPVGPVVQTSKPAEHHGVVQIYKEVGQQDSYSFRVYLATNNESDIADIRKEVRTAKKKYMKIEKPPQCQKLLEENRKYRLISEPQGDITPEDIQFTLAVVKMKGYFEAFFEQRPPFKLSLIEAESEQIVWTATIREGDCVENTVEKTRSRSCSRKRNCSMSEMEPSNKRPHWCDESGDDLIPDGVRTKETDMSDKQLMQVAKCMGKEWKCVAIAYLDLTKQDVEDIETKAEGNQVMMKFHMLHCWKSRQSKGEAGAMQLYEALNQEDVPREVIDKLDDIRRSGSPK